jgi:hypothetical protein
MSVKVMSKVWEWSKAEGAELLVMLALADFCNDEGECYPGIKRIAFKARMSERSVQRIIAKLESIGEIVKDSGAGLRVQGSHGGLGCTNKYRLVVTSDKLAPVILSPPSSEGCQTGSVRGDTAMTPKPSVETSAYKNPPTPQGGNGLFKDGVPKAREAWIISEIFHRTYSTPWSPKEQKALKTILPIEKEDLELVQEYYAAFWGKTENNYCRRTLLTFLNNYSGEIDRARQWKQAKQEVNVKPKMKLRFLS